MGQLQQLWQLLLDPIPRKELIVCLLSRDHSSRQVAGEGLCVVGGGGDRGELRVTAGVCCQRDHTLTGSSQKVHLVTHPHSRSLAR